MRPNILGISLIHGQFKAVRFQRWHAVGAYEEPNPVESLEEFSGALDTALAVTGFKGKYISIVYEGQWLEHAFLQLPKMGKRDLALFLKRKAQQEKTFAGEAVYAYTRSDSPKGGDVVLLSIMEKSFFDFVVKACEERGFFLLQMFPASAAVARQLLQFGASEKEIIGFVAGTGPKSLLLIGKQDGSVLFERSMNFNLSGIEDFDRVGREINRSVLFAKQQFGVAASRLIILQRMSEQGAAKIRPQVDVPIEVSDIGSDIYFYIIEGLKISPRHESNLVSVDVQQRSLRKTMLRVTIGVVILFWIGSLAVAGVLELMIYQEKDTIDALMTKNAERISLKSEWDKRYSELDRKRRIIKALRDERKPPMAGWFLGYLGNVVPEGLTMTKMFIEQTGGGWTVKLQGLSTIRHDEMFGLLSNFERTLIDSPFRFNVVKDWRKSWLDQLKRGVIADKTAKDQFVIEGRIQ